MKELKEIVDGIAHSLNMTVDSLVKVYPQLRTEYSWYYLCDKLQDVLITMIIVIGLVGSVILIPILVISDSDDEDFLKAFKFFKWCLVVLGVSTVLLMAVIALKGFMCPDIMIIKEFLK